MITVRSHTKDSPDPLDALHVKHGHPVEVRIARGERHESITVLRLSEEEAMILMSELRRWYDGGSDTE